MDLFTASTSSDSDGSGSIKELVEYAFQMVAMILTKYLAI